MPSSAIAAMHYNASRRTLTVVFRGTGSRYRYHDVSPEEWATLEAAPSKGTYFNEVFKNRGYRYERRDPAR